MAHLSQLRHGGLLQQVQVPARCVIAAAAKKQKPKRRKPKQPVSQRISYAEGVHGWYCVKGFVSTGSRPISRCLLLL